MYGFLSSILLLIEKQKRDGRFSYFVNGQRGGGREIRDYVTTTQPLSLLSRLSSFLALFSVRRGARAWLRHS